MLLKKREMPIPLMQLQALIPRLSPDYPLLAKLKWDEKARLKGYEGERNIDYFIGLLADRFHILHDVCLTVNSLIVQIDSIIISNKAVYIIEMKNYSQKVIFDTKLNQFIQTDGKVDKGFNNPIMQAENQRLQLRMWLQQHGINIPIYFLVVFSNSNTIIEVKGEESLIADVVAHADNLPKKILEKESMIENDREFDEHEIGKVILRGSKEFSLNIMKEYKINSEDILSGVHCPKCGTLGMERIYANWKCRRCEFHSKLAHRKALDDYFVLLGSVINNTTCRKFLNINSKDVATRILKTSGLNYDEKYRRWEKRS